MPPPALQEKRSWKAVMGFEAWSLLKDPDHRVVFIGAGFLNAPLVAYMQHTHPHLEELAVRNSTAFMSLGQVMEVVGLFGLAWLVTQFRMKWLFLVGIAIAVLRFALFSQNTVWGMGLGIFLHGICFTLFYMTAQIYLDERISPTMRSRAQALLTLMMSGVGNMAGALGCAWWLSQCVSAAGKTDWPRYWGGLCVVSVLILAWFALQYQGKKSDGTVK
jgi:MFS family permease